MRITLPPLQYRAISMAVNMTMQDEKFKFVSYFPKP